MLFVMGSTGSIGTQTLEVAKAHNIRVSGLAALNEVDVMERQIKEFQPEQVVLYDEKAANELRNRVIGRGVKVVSGMEGIIETIRLDSVELVVNGIFGAAGVVPTLETLRAKKRLALANKESLVMAGDIIMNEAKNNCIEIMPIDSEHNAIYQCLLGRKKSEVDRLIITCSGGPFRMWPREKIETATPEDALKHPTWSMGADITISSALLLNKGREILEAMYLFDVPIERIDVVIHPQSVVHSMVRFIDGSIVALLGPTDMRVPIQFAITYPNLRPNAFPQLDYFHMNLTFEPPDMERFPALAYAYEVAKKRGTAPAVYNAAGEVAVREFLRKKILFGEINRLIRETLDAHQYKSNPSLEDLFAIDKWARDYVRAKVNGGGKA
ncbi:MAG: 1-deoxy-D-xylulose-5-phosphate reductoisomerase [Candidatus Korarchaeota archaeon]